MVHRDLNNKADLQNKREKGVVVQFGGARLLTSRLARTLSPPKVAKCATTEKGCRTPICPSGARSIALRSGNQDNTEKGGRPMNTCGVLHQPTSLRGAVCDYAAARKMSDVRRTSGAGGTA